MMTEMRLILAPLFTRAMAYLLHDEARDLGRVAGFEKVF